MAKKYEVIGPYPIAVIRDKAKIDIDPPDGQGNPGGTFTEDEIEPGCKMELNVQAGLVKVVDEPPAKTFKDPGGKP